MSEIDFNFLSQPVHTSKLLREFGIVYDLLADAVDEINSVFSIEVKLLK